MHLDRFSTLPSEIRVAILSCITDLPTLHRLTYASTAMRVAFEGAPAQVVRQIICRIPRRCRSIMAATSRVYCHILSEPSSERRLTVTHQQRPQPLGFHAEEDVKPDLDNIPADASLTAVQWLVLVACRIDQLTAIFLTLSLERFNRVELQHMSDNSFRFPWESHRGPPKPFPQGRPFNPQERATVSWVEVFRTATACWGAQLRSLQSQLKSYPTVRCPGPDAQRMLDELERFLTGFPDWQKDQIHSVEELLSKEMGAFSDMNQEAFQKFLAVSDFYSTTPIELPSISEPPADAGAVSWGQGIQASERPSTAHCWFLIHASPDSGYNRLMRGLEWTPFRRLGFGIWDRQRMCAMGLSSLPFKDPGTGIAYGRVNIRNWRVGQVSFAWRSLKLDGKRLTPDPTEDGSAG